MAELGHAAGWEPVADVMTLAFIGLDQPRSALQIGMNWLASAAFSSF